ncbi:RagB/SusD family nutrient uptake outer membrane protein [Sphingobacterium oryzagri]|uniref:RagB/SusD family nutrient uptake outer membrane protein n=1 Tax=Sphingobacterium oryzagri TaxID=3025669 RepID=A0ABY7WNB8_9SPHI|nr:RagB/SusD family nutrient uptake outer membrane protein [Sphingobacterium sp. KACC 22765]WDF70515.1 RagB/SusD family nutrient uptake outer membrane protein [Sphingobacterium sp. KACC 22765]
MKKTYKLLMAFCLLICGTGCNSFLDENPVSAPSNENFWQSEKDGNAAVASMYALLRQALNNGLFHYAHGDLPTDIFSTDRDIGGAGDFNQIQEGNWSIAVPAAETGREMMRNRRFDYFYNAIVQANTCIANLPKIPAASFDSNYETSIRHFLGEAYFCRAFAYFYMSRVWGGVPIVSDDMGNTLDMANYPRATAEAVLDKALADALLAKQYLGWDNVSTVDKTVRANKGAVLALLAHIYAWESDYANCENAAKELMNSNYYSFASRNNYTDIFKGNSTEGIFEIAQNSANEAALSMIGFYTLKTPYLTTNTGVSLWPLDTLTLRQTLFDNPQDLRVRNGFAFFDSADPVCLKYRNLTYSTNSTVSVPLFMSNIIVFRLSDIALLLAEAYAYQGNYNGAKDLLNRIRGLAGLNATQATNDQLFEAVINERGKELFLEGHRFYDLVRLAKIKGVYRFGSGGSTKITASEFNRGKYYWPIDPLLIANNPLFAQTPYWSSEMQ